MAKPRSQYVCQGCGFTSAKWLGRCSECAEWNSLVEESVGSRPAGALSGGARPTPLGEVRVDDMPRWKTGVAELDRVLGGGLVQGSLVLLGGDPGIGKSTLLLQAFDGLAQSGKKVLYVSGEESVQQTALRAERLGVTSKGLLILAETQLEKILEQAESVKPDVLAVDSVQTVHCGGLESVPGSIGQVREAAGRLLTFAKTRGVPVILVGHVTKDGGLAGPKTLEHVVDAVLYFEGERSQHYRVLRTTKNRFGSTNELGVFEMRSGGLAEVANPSALFLAERPVGVPGSVVVASVEGSRPILVEIQALVASSAGQPRRTALGIDPNRVSLLLAVIERRCGIDVLGQDVFVNVAGGVRLVEPASDLGLLAAVASSARGKAVDAHTLCFGEVGLAGEVRAVSRVELRLAEARKMGFRRCVLPELSKQQLDRSVELELVGVRDVNAALEALIRMSGATNRSMAMAMGRWTVFAALMLAACGDDPLPVAKDMSIGKNTLRYVTDTVTLPTGELEYTYDPLGEGVKRNRLGAIVGSLNFSGVKVQESEDHAIARGDGLNLLAVTSADPEFIADPGAQAEFWAAEKMAPPEDGGVGTWTIDRAVAQATFRGPLAGSRFQSDDPRPLKDPPTFFFKISLSGGDAVLIPIVGARITFVAAPDRLTEGVLNGGMRKTDIDTLLIPAIARLLTDGLHKMPCDDKCMKNNEDIAKRFDTGGCGSAVAMDTNIDICEVSENGLVKNLLAAEVQLFDAAGKWAPNAANTKPDSLTMGVAFTATRADFVP